MKQFKKNTSNTSHGQSRRNFLKTLSSAAASVLIAGAGGACSINNDTSDSTPNPQSTVYSPRDRVANPYVASNGRPLLVCVSGTDFRTMLAAGLEALGGLGQLITNNSNVLIKPNFNHFDPYPGISSIDSILALVEKVRQVTNGSIGAGDNGYRDTGQVYQEFSFVERMQAAGATALRFNETYPVRQDYWPNSKPDFRVYKEIYDAPIIINFPVLKRHNLASLTCALKNNVGTIHGPGATSTRNYLHYRSTDFHEEIAEIAGLVNPELTIVDARSILTIGGPYLENGIVEEAGKIVICGDMVATDAYCAAIMEEHDSTFGTEFIRGTLNRAEQIGLGTSDLNRLEIIEISI